MPNTDPQTLLIDRPLDPEAAARVKAPGVGVILTFGCNIEVILREAAEIAKMRDRLVYIFIVTTDIEEQQEQFKEWEKLVFQKTHAIKADRFKTYHSNLVTQIAEYSRSFDIRLLMVEENNHQKFKFPWTKSITKKLNDASHLPPIFILRTAKLSEQPKENIQTNNDWILLGLSLVALALAGLITRTILPERLELIIYVLVLAIIASKVSRIVSFVGTLIGVIIYNFIHVKPYNSLSIEGPTLFLVLASLLIVSMIINTLSWQARDALNDARLQERRKSAFFNLTRDLLKIRDTEGVLVLVERHIKDVIGSEIAVYVKREDKIEILRTSKVDISQSQSDKKACDLALNSGIEAGLGTQTEPLAFGLYLPIASLEGMAGCLAVYPPDDLGEFPAEQLRLLDTFTGLLGISLERIWYEEVRLNSERQFRDAEMQNTLLRSVSHDLKTPLTSITGFANQLHEDPDLPQDVRKNTYQTIRDEAWRLTNLINNLLSLTKLESGALLLNKELMFVEELFGTAISHVRPRLTEHKIHVDLPDDIPDVQVDPMLFNQALVNLMENAIKYTPAGTNITLRARKISTGIQISVLDDGPGLPKGDSEKIFEKFVRSVQGKQTEGTGLGLAIVRAIAELHGGTATARNRTAKGARFDIRLPVAEQPIENLETNNEHSN